MSDLRLHLSIALALVENLFVHFGAGLFGYLLLEKRIQTVHGTAGSDLHYCKPDEGASLSVA